MLSSRNWAPASEHNPEGMRKWKPSVASTPAPSEAALDVEHEPDEQEDIEEGAA